MTINAEYKFKPGLKTAIQNGSSLNTVPKFNTQKSDATVSSVFTSNTKSTSSSTRDAALQALSTTQKPSNIFSSNEYAKYGNFVGGMRNVNPSDYKERKKMTLKVSFDNGLTWPEKHWIMFDQYRSLGYSSITSIDEKTIGILFESSQADIAFIQIKLDNILRNKE